ncbi:unnamed protein product [Arabidopsis lyrata]|nr:unnamed protein product [Arabidopsis lyrata]
MNHNINFYFINKLDHIDRPMNVKEECGPPQTKQSLPEYWTESYVKWSPLGTYLVTLHKNGVAVWGGADTFHRHMRYRNFMVKLVDFSPCEKYLVTYQSQEPSNPRDASEVDIKIFDVRSGKTIKDFKGRADDFSVRGAVASWPVFKWAGGNDDKYCAKLSKNTISIYETKTFNLLGDKPMEAVDVVDMCWSPTDSILALLKGGGKQPAKVVIVEIPSKVELRQKYLVGAIDCKMYWHNNGEYLAIKVDGHTSSRFEIFCLKERDIPIEVLEVENKVLAFAWEPNGQRFSVIHGDQPKPDCSFYSMHGRISKLEFFNVDKLQTMAKTEHLMATDIAWDPTGRYVTTTVTSAQETDNGFNMWSFDGKLLYRILKEDPLFQLDWRPTGTKHREGGKLRSALEE